MELRTASGHAFRLSPQSLLGSGGQGEVYKVTAAGRDLALKLYFEGTSTPSQREAIRRLTASPLDTEGFLWPLELVEATAGPRFGYLMELREPRFRSLNAIVSGRVAMGFTASLDAAIKLSSAFLRLHAKGLAYRDINLGNVFVDPTTGDIAICDNDNVSTNGAEYSGVLGTSGFMAPEIERGAALPSADTDRHSLAVLLFYLLFRHHPLHGEREYAIRCLDAAARRRLYGDLPIFIFDPENAQNRPVAGIHNHVVQLWNAYPPSLRRHFERAFTLGLREPARRVREPNWRQALAGARDLMTQCICKATIFPEPERTDVCWRCGRALPLVTYLEFQGNIAAPGRFVLAAGKGLSRFHIEGKPPGDATRLATVVPVDGAPRALALRNDSPQSWSYAPLGGPSREWRPGVAIPCLAETRFHFGTVTATTRAPHVATEGSPPFDRGPR